MLSFVRWGKIIGIVSSMLSSARWRVDSNVRKVLAVGFRICRSKSPRSSSGVWYILSSTSVVSVGRMSSYKWASELPGSFGLSCTCQLMESFCKPARPAIGGPSTSSRPVSRTSSRRALCRMEEISWERYAGRRDPPPKWRTRKFGRVSRNLNMSWTFPIVL